MPATLARYAEAQPNPNAKCRVCALDPKVQRQIITGREEGITAVTISRWLDNEHEVKISPEAIRRHIANHAS